MFGGLAGPWTSPEHNLIIPDTSPLGIQSCSAKYSEQGKPLWTEEKSMGELTEHQVCAGRGMTHNLSTSFNPEGQGLLASSWSLSH